MKTVGSSSFRTPTSTRTAPTDRGGGPVAYNDSNTGSDHLANAGMEIRSGKVVLKAGEDGDGVILGADGQPRVFPGGMIASKTWYRHRDKGEDDPAAYVDAESVPYIVVPPLIVQKTVGVVRGCTARVSLGRRSVDCVVADLGPSRKTGELSIAAARALGIPESPRHGGREQRDVLYELWPGEAVPGYELQPSGT
jgi:hypothetical protein